MSAAAQGTVRPGRILVVDDEDAVAEVFRDYLVLIAGHEVETCSSGQSATWVVSLS